MLVLAVGVFVLAMKVFFVGVLFVFDVLVLGMVVRDMLAESGSVFGTFVCGVGFEFGAIRRAVLFDFLGFVFGEFGFGSRLIFGGVEMRVFLAIFFFGFFLREFSIEGGLNIFHFVFVEIGTTGESVGFRVVGGFFVFRFGKFERERSGLLIVQFRLAMGFRRSGGVRSGRHGQLERRRFVARRIGAVRGKRGVRGYADIFVGGDGSGFGLGTGVGEEPAW